MKSVTTEFKSGGLHKKRLHEKGWGMLFETRLEFVGMWVNFSSDSELLQVAVRFHFPFNRIHAIVALSKLWLTAEYFDFYDNPRKLQHI